jgi:hypothetical protein
LYLSIFMQENANLSKLCWWTHIGGVGWPHLWAHQPLHVTTIQEKHAQTIFHTWIMVVLSLNGGRWASMDWWAHMQNELTSNGNISSYTQQGTLLVSPHQRGGPTCHRGDGRPPPKLADHPLGRPTTLDAPPTLHRLMHAPMQGNTTPSHLNPWCNGGLDPMAHKFHHTDRWRGTLSGSYSSSLSINTLLTPSHSRHTTQARKLSTLSRCSSASVVGS